MSDNPNDISTTNVDEGLAALLALAEQEKIIHAHVASYAEVGIALERIRNERLYSARSYDTFEGYCRGEWDWSKTHVNRLIAQAVINRALTPVGVTVNERVARELALVIDADAETAENEEAIRVAYAKAQSVFGDRPTGKQVREIVKPKPAPATPDTDAEADAEADDTGDDDTEAEAPESDIDWTDVGARKHAYESGAGTYEFSVEASGERMADFFSMLIDFTNDLILPSAEAVATWEADRKKEAVKAALDARAAFNAKVDGFVAMLNA